MNAQKTKAYLEKIDGKSLAIASEEIADRDGDILTIDGWDLKNFKKNPVLMWLHMMDGSTMPIGKANGIRVEEIAGKRKLVFEPEFHELTEEARTIKEMFAQGFLSAFSVGFQPKEWTIISESGEFPPRYKYMKQELLEISAVPIPALPTATIIERAQKAKMDVKSIQSVLNQFKYAKEKKDDEQDGKGDEPKKPDETPVENATPLAPVATDAPAEPVVPVATPDTEEDKSISKRGRTLSAKNESKVKQAQALLSEVLAEIRQEASGDEEDDSKGYVTQEEMKKHVDRVAHLITEIQKDRTERKTVKVESQEEKVMKTIEMIFEKALQKATGKQSKDNLDEKGGEK